MPASKKDYMALFHYVDDKGYGGDIEVHEDTLGDLFATLGAVQNGAKERGWTGRPADKEKEYKNTYVRVNKPQTPMEQAASDVFSGQTGMNCPIDDTPMERRIPEPGTLVKSGPFKGQPLPASWKCPRCQKQVYDKRAHTQSSTEIPY